MNNDERLTALALVILRGMEPSERIIPGLTAEDAKRVILNNQFKCGGLEQVKAAERGADEIIESWENEQ